MKRIVVTSTYSFQIKMENKLSINFKREGDWKGKENLSTLARGKGDWKGQKKMSTHCKGEKGWKNKQEV